MTEKQKRMLELTGISETELVSAVLSPEEIIETLAEQDFRLCLLELGIEEEFE